MRREFDSRIPLRHLKELSNDMSMIQIMRRGFVFASLTAVYILGVALFMGNAERLVGGGNGLVGGAAFLTLFVVSAAVTGSLIIGKPVLMYIDGAKKDAVRLFIANIAWLFAMLVLFFSLAWLVR
jgi:hypothetical protein